MDILVWIPIVHLQARTLIVFFASGIVILMPSSSCTPGDVKNTKRSSRLLQSYSNTSQKQVNNMVHNKYNTDSVLLHTDLYI